MVTRRKVLLPPMCLVFLIGVLSGGLLQAQYSITAVSGHGYEKKIYFKKTGTIHVDTDGWVSIVTPYETSVYKVKMKFEFAGSEYYELEVIGGRAFIRVCYMVVENNGHRIKTGVIELQKRFARKPEQITKYYF